MATVKQDAANEAAPANDVTFEDLLRDVDQLVARLRREIEVRSALEDRADVAEEIVLEELAVYIVHQGIMFGAPPSILSVDSFAPLMEPLRRHSAAVTLHLVDTLFTATQQLRDFCQLGEPDDVSSESSAEPELSAPE
jgi:isocitrate dehydrogenase kinase/phosphatase